MDDIAIRAEGLSKRYRIQQGARARYGTLRDALVEAVRAPFSRRSSPDSAGNDSYIWALKDVSFEVKRGEVVGIIGRNGAGKTTLLKILSRITEPTEGYAEVRGRVGSLLEVGTGFHPELTGRENIYLNGAILGMKKAEIDRKFDEIVSFAEIQKFIDTPVKFYSSGMYVRLAFAVAAHLDPEILLVDEVLAVGDAAFQKKCLGKMGEVAAGGRTVLFVSHNMAAVQGLCNKALWLEAGKCQLIGTVQEVVSQYLMSIDLTSKPDLTRIVAGRSGNGYVRFVDWSVVDEYYGEGYIVRSNHPCTFRIRYDSAGMAELRDVSVSLTIKDVLGQPITTAATIFQNKDFAVLPPQGILTCHFERLPLVPGVYTVHLWCKVGSDESDRIPDAGTFTVVPEDVYGTGRLPQAESHGFILSQYSWAREG
jgi:lipopolysaccharide transport system ATP-binding protein